MREPRGQKELDMLIDTTGNVNGGVTDLSARGKRNDPFRGMGNLFHKFLRKAGFYYQTSFYSPAGAHFWIYRLPVRPPA